MAASRVECLACTINTKLRKFDKIVCWRTTGSHSVTGASQAAPPLSTCKSPKTASTCIFEAMWASTETMASCKPDTWHIQQQMNQQKHTETRTLCDLHYAIPDVSSSLSSLIGVLENSWPNALDVATQGLGASHCSHWTLLHIHHQTDSTRFKQHKLSTICILWPMPPSGSKLRSSLQWFDFSILYVYSKVYRFY